MCPRKVGYEARMMVCRDMNAATSQEVFAGPYLDDPAEKAKFSAAFMDMTNGFLAFPLCLPGTAVWRAKRGRLYILRVLARAAARSKAAMQVGSWRCQSQACTSIRHVHVRYVMLYTS